MEYEIKREAMRNSEKKYLLLDSTKYGKSALLTYAHLGDMDKVIVDEEMNPGLKELCDRYNVKLEKVKADE